VHATGLEGCYKKGLREVIGGKWGAGGLGKSKEKEERGIICDNSINYVCVKWESRGQYLGLRCIKQMEISGCYMMWKFMMCSGHEIRNYRRLWWVEHVVWRCVVGSSMEVLDGVLERCPAIVLRGMVCKDRRLMELTLDLVRWLALMMAVLNCQIWLQRCLELVAR